MIYYARCEHPTKTYLMWVKEHGSGWGVHSTLVQREYATVVSGCRFWEADWGESWKWNGLALVDALTMFRDKLADRINHGYTNAEMGTITQGEDTTSSTMTMEELDDAISHTGN